MSVPEIIFKGGSMNGIGITYPSGSYPESNSEIIINLDHASEFFGEKPGEVYCYAVSLRSWVYDHEMEVVAEDD